MRMWLPAWDCRRWDVPKDAISTFGFEELSRVFDKSSKSLMRMFGPKGNPPQASNLFAVIGYLQEQGGIHLEVKARKVA